MECIILVYVSIALDGFRLFAFGSLGSARKGSLEGVYEYTGHHCKSVNKTWARLRTRFEIAMGAKIHLYLFSPQ